MVMRLKKVNAISTKQMNGSRDTQFDTDFINRATTIPAWRYDQYALCASAIADIISSLQTNPRGHTPVVPEYLHMDSALSIQ